MFPSGHCGRLLCFYSATAVGTCGNMDNTRAWYQPKLRITAGLATLLFRAMQLKVVWSFQRLIESTQCSDVNRKSRKDLETRGGGPIKAGSNCLDPNHQPNKLQGTFTEGTSPLHSILSPLAQSGFLPYPNSYGIFVRGDRTHNLYWLKDLSSLKNFM